MGCLIKDGEIYSSGSAVLSDLLDVNISNPLNGDVPVYNSTTQEWENKLVVTQAEQNVLGSKNILYHTFTDRTSDGVTYHVNDDRSISATISGTHSSDTNMPITNDWNGFDISAYIGKTLICSGGQGIGSTFILNFQIVDSSGNFIAYMPIEGEYTVPNNAKYCIPMLAITSSATGSYTFKPMIRLKGTDSTYVPYAPTNHDLAYVRDGWKKNGAYNYASLYYNSNQYVNGITFYFQSDGTIYYLGTAEQDVYLRISYDIKVSKTGLYRLTGVPKGAANTVLYTFTESDGNIQFRDLGSGGMGTLEAGVSYGIYLLIGSGTAIPNSLVLKPMLTSDLNAFYDDFVKPAKTNLELTNPPNNLGTITNITSYTENNMYTCPSDGYIRYSIMGDTAGAVIIVGNSGTPTSNYLYLGAAQAINSSHDSVLRGSVFVRKGMRAYSLFSPAEVVFIPFV